MLKDRRVLLEREVANLTKECGQRYLNLIRYGNDPQISDRYIGQFKHLMMMKGELELVIQLIEEGHD